MLHGKIHLPLVGLLLVLIFSTALEAQTKQYKLIRAIDRDNYEEAQELLKEGVSPNTRSRMDGSPLLVQAARSGTSRMLTLLLDYDADVNIKDREQGETALMIRSSVGDLDDVRLLLQRGAQANIADRGLETALTKAVRLRHYRVVKALLEAGADIDKVDVTGNSPLDYARQGRDRRMERLLTTVKPKAPKNPSAAGPGMGR